MKQSLTGVTTISAKWYCIWLPEINRNFTHPLILLTVLCVMFTCDVLVLGTGAQGQQKGEISRGKAGDRSETI